MHYAQSRLTDITIVTFDTETTGLQPIMHRLVDAVSANRLYGFERFILQSERGGSQTSYRV